jgi:hypothetical protein
MEMKEFRKPSTAAAEVVAKGAQERDLNRLVELAERIGDKPGWFFARAAMLLKDAAAREPRTKRGRAWKRAADQFDMLAKRMPDTSDISYPATRRARLWRRRAAAAPMNARRDPPDEKAWFATRSEH